MEISILTISGIFLSLTCLFLSIFLSFFCRNNAQRLMVVYNIFVAVWGAGLAVVGVRNLSIENAAFVWKLSQSDGFFVPVIFMHLILEVCEVKRRKLLIFAYSQAAVFVVLTWFNKLGYRLDYVFNSFYYVRAENFAYTAMSILWFSSLIYGFYMLVKTFLMARGIKRKQLMYLIIAMFIGFFGGVSHFYLSFGIMVYPFPETIVIYILITAYAIFRHRLLNVEVIVKKTLVFTGLLASIFGMLILPTLIIQEYLFRGAGAAGRVLGLAISGIIIIFSMRRIEGALVNVTEKFLFQKKYDYKELLKTFTA